MPSEAEHFICRRCGRPVGVSADQYETFERMHYVCFHYEFEHDPQDPDLECSAGGCPSHRVGLAQTLREWTDWDLAAFKLGRAIGLFEREDDWLRRKSIMWTDNHTGSGLRAALLALTKAGLLERREEPDEQFRWRL
jgi:hypothetical protein